MTPPSSRPPREQPSPTRRGREIAALALVAVLTFGIATYVASRRVVVVLLALAGSAVWFGALAVIAHRLRRRETSQQDDGMRLTLIASFMFAVAGQLNMWVFDGPDALSFGLATASAALLVIGLVQKQRSQTRGTDEDAAP